MLPGGVHSYVDLPRVLTNLDQILNFTLQFLHIHQVCYRCHTESMIDVQSKFRVILRMAFIEIEKYAKTYIVHDRRYIHFTITRRTFWSIFCPSTSSFP